MGRETTRNTLYTPESWEFVNKKNKDLMTDFLEYLRSTDHSDTTIFQYYNDLRIFFCYMQEHMDNKFFVDLTKRDLIHWQNIALGEWKWSPARIRRFKATLSSLSNYIENILDDEYPNYRSIINKIPNPVNEPVRDKTILTKEQTDGLLQTLLDKGEYEKAAALALALCSGRRKSELPRFKMEYFDDKNVVCNNSLYKTPEKVKTKGRGKTGKLLNLYVLKHPFQPYLDAFIKYREENHIESEWFLYNPLNPSEQVPVSQLDIWAEQFSKILGVPFYWHCARHRWCSMLSEEGLPAEAIQAIAGWSNIAMVSIYNDRDVDDTLEEYFQDGEIVTKKADLSKL